MDMPDIRVEKGHAEPEEVAALTALLLARAHRPGRRQGRTPERQTGAGSFRRRTRAAARQ
ncbi:acyl-CoA carboxylase epsilon subunit, partial [Streptomyces sp. NPDC007070]|uniref:acyl-CoA carboxylase epsilon subunit n=1 Tax=Streptomyces sp. NPDC007070 TaxID=3154312 RepID=UPI0033D97F81